MTEDSRQRQPNTPHILLSQVIIIRSSLISSHCSLLLSIVVLLIIVCYVSALLRRLVVASCVVVVRFASSLRVAWCVFFRLLVTTTIMQRTHADSPARSRPSIAGSQELKRYRSPVTFSLCRGGHPRYVSIDITTNQPNRQTFPNIPN